MKTLADQYKRGIQLHHAYLLPGSIAESKSSVLAFINQTLHVTTDGNPDVLTMHYPTLGVDSARELKEQTNRKSLSGTQYFIVSFSFATSEAQNALLKLFEEPVPGTHFFILTPSEATVSSTLRSRLIVLEVDGAHEEQSALTFIRTQKGARMALIQKCIDEKNKEALLSLMTSLEMEMHRRMLVSGATSETARVADALLKARRYLEMKSASVKMIGEYLAAVLPVST